MKTTISNMIRVEEPSEAVREYAKTLRLPNPDFEKKQRMGFWTGRTPKEIRLYERDGNALVFPFGLLKDLWPMVREGAWTLDFRQDETVEYGELIPLYDYQDEAVARMIAAKYGILIAPAGSGKTQMMLRLVQTYGKKTLWLCAKHDLLKQSYDRAKQYMDESLFGVITAGKVNIGTGITFATVQTLAGCDLDRYRHEWDVIVCDEVHNLAVSATTVTRYQKVLNNLAARHKYGMTATCARSDGLIQATFALVGPIRYEVSESAVADRIMKVHIKPVRTETELTDECLAEDGTIDYIRLIEHLTTDEERTKLIVRCLTEEKEHSCLILSNRIAHLETIQQMMPDELREKSALITGKMTSKRAKAEREEILNRMRTGEMKYLLATYSLAKEGLDVPRLDRLFMATPEKFSSIVIQSVGRIARVAEGKGQPIAYDFVDEEIGFCKRAWKERCRHYRRISAKVLTEMEMR